MDSKRRYLHLIPSALVVTSLILSACQETSHQVTPRVASGNKGVRTESMAERNKLSKDQQRYVINPTELASYKNHLAAIFDSMSEDALTPWSALFKLKVWVLGPVDLKKEASSSVAITYSEVSTQPMARQTQYQVWFDSRVFEKLNDKDKAESILEGFLTSLYTFKNLSNNELCDLVKEAHPGSECTLSISKGADDEKMVQKAKAVKRTLTPTVYRKALVQEDYNNIRRVKAYILQQGGNLRHADLIVKMTESGFDERVFSLKMKTAGEAKDPSIMEGEAIESLFAQAKALDKTQAICHYLQSATQAGCEVAAQRTREEVPGSGIQQVLLSLTVKESEVKDVLLSEVVYQVPKIKVAKYSDLATKEEFFLVPLTGVSMNERVVGASYRMNYLLAVKAVVNKTEVIKLEGVLSVPGIVTKVTQDESKGKVLCEGAMATLKDKSTDVVVIAKSDKYLGSLKEIMKGLSPIPPCW
ncbi:MAG: hypothetical protein KUL82_06295 [Bdellovibrio sp.]|nr:hypothetical protein [Bdellovibrio sp.]